MIFRFTFFLLAVIIATGCGITHIMVQNNIPADIYMNGQYKGKGVVEIQRTGIPQKVNVTAKYEGREIGSLLLKRKFTGLTFLAGYCSYGFGFFFCWQYPDTAIIPTDMPSPPAEQDYYKSPWDMPPSKTKGRW